MSKARSFYKSKYEVTRKKAEAVYNHYYITATLDLTAATRLDFAESYAVLVELRDEWKRLLWFWIVNFDKILKSLAKYQEGLKASDDDLVMKTKSIESLSQINSWLKPTQIQYRDHASAPVESTFFHKKKLRNKLSLPLAEKLLGTIEADNANRLKQQVTQVQDVLRQDPKFWLDFLFALLQFSTIKGSRFCVDELLSYIADLRNLDDNFHWLLSSIGRVKVLQGQRPQDQNHDTVEFPRFYDSEIVDRLTYITAKLAAKLEKPLFEMDCFG